MTPDQSDDVIANLPRSRPSRRSPRRDAAQAKAAGAGAHTPPAATVTAAAATKAATPPQATAPPTPKAAPKPKAATKPAIPAAGYAVPDADPAARDDVITETIRAVGHLAQAGLGLLRGLVPRG